MYIIIANDVKIGIKRKIKNISTTFIFSLQFFISFGQDKYIIESEKLVVTDTIFRQEQITVLKNDAKFTASDIIITNDNAEGHSVLVKKQDKFWLVYEIPFLAKSLNQFCHLIGLSENKKYFYAEIQINNIARGTETTSKLFYTIDLVNKSFTYFNSYEFKHEWEYGEKDILVKDLYSISKSDVITNNNKITVLNTCFNNTNLTALDCLNNGGEFEIKNGKLIKTKNYILENKQMKSIKYVGNICVGMHIDEISLRYSQLEWVAHGKYGYDIEGNPGLEISDGKELLFFVILDDKNKTINTILLISPKNNIEKLNTNITIEEVLKIYPKSKIRIDLVDDWEHLFIQEKNIDLIFKTNEKNRIALYEYDNNEKDMVFKKIKINNAKPNYITIK